ncbi:MAG TPA: ABC transporter permease [Steroidobacteraceae bacterium]|jgi:ABC-2 type transport system permease protein|nr:ABC transporter permease [Steroidobacteraceae bacterium]
MRYTLLIALREFAENAKTKGFWIGIFILPLILALSIGVSSKLARSEPSRYFVVVDKSGAFAEPIERSIEWERQRSVLQALGQYVQENLRAGQQPGVDLATHQTAVDTFIAAGGKDAYLARLRPALRENAPAFKEPTRLFMRADLPNDIDPDAGSDAILAQLKPYLLGERRISVGGGDAPLFAALMIAPDAVDGATRWTGTEAIQYWSTNLAVNNLPDLVRNALNAETRRRLYVARGVDVAQVHEIEATYARLGTFDPGKAAGTETVSTADRIAGNVPVGFVYLLWMSIFTVMQMLLNNTIEEKSNRIAEVLLSSVTPNEIMMGKLLGIAGVGLTIVGTWLATVFIAAQLYQGPGADIIGPAVDAVASSNLIPMFLLCFLLGYLIYAGLFLSIGALCNDIKEAQQVQGPMMLIMMVPLFTMVFINRDPHGALATIMTWIPLYTPFTMMNRAAADPPLMELIGATLLMIATAALLLWSAGRIFRMAMLRAGNRPRLAELVQWIRGRGDA